MDTLNTLQITLQHPHNNVWSVLAVLKFARPELPNQWKQTQLRLPGDWQRQLLEWETLEPAKYGQLLGEALFHSGLDELLQTAIASSTHTRLFLVIEPPDLKTLHWERLYFPAGDGDDTWHSLAQEQRILFSYYIPARASKYYPYLLQRDVNVLFFICSPTQTQSLRDKTFTAFATAPLAATLKASMGEIPHTILYQAQETSWQNLQDRLNAGGYTALHIVSHGYYDTESKQNYLILLDKAQQLKAVSVGEFVKKLEPIAPLPHLLFFSSCNTADPAALTSVHGNFAREARDKLATPAVIAMSDTVTQETANILSEAFYSYLYRKAYVDVALAKAGYKLLEMPDLRERRDRYLPVLYQNLGGSPLFGFEPKRLQQLDKKEISDGLDRLKNALLKEKRAPLAIHEFDLLAPEARASNEAALVTLDQFCHEVTDISFATLAQDETGEQLPPYNAECPFPGMRPFKLDAHDGVDYSKYFFGRDEVLKQVRAILAEPERNILGIMGASGSGKSSLVFAGVLKQEQEANPELQIRDMRPFCHTSGERTETPVQHLNGKLQDLERNKPILLYIDQFEEVFTACGIQERQAFFQRLLALPADYPQLKIVFSIRADYAAEDAASDSLLRPLIEKAYKLYAMNADELRAAMEQQTDSVGLEFEEGLAHRILSETVMDEAGAMPLLQYLLWLLWQHRRGRHLRTEDYEKIGGVSSAIANTADAIMDRYAAPDNDDGSNKETTQAQYYLQNIFLRLTRPDTERKQRLGDHYRDTRQRVPKTSLYPQGADPELVSNLIKELADARLIVTYENEVEISHESLITHWPKLKDWLKNRQLIEMQQELGEYALKWHQARESKQRHMNELLRHSGSQIDAVHKQRQAHALFLNQIELDYLDACSERDQRVERNRKNVKRFAVVMALLFVTAVVISILAVQQKNKSDDRLAEQHFLKGIELRDNPYQEWDKAEKYFAKALDVVADKVQKANIQFTYADMHSFSPKLLVVMHHKKQVQGATLFADDTRALTWSEDGTVQVWDISSGETIGQPMRHEGSVGGATLFAGDTRVLTWSNDGTARIWDATSGEAIGQPMRHEGSVNGAKLFAGDTRVLTWSNDGIAPVWSGSVRVWDANSGAALGQPISLGDFVRGVTLFADNARVLTWSDDGTARVWDSTSGALIGQPMRHENSVNGATLFASDTRVLTWSSYGTAQVWDVDTGIPIEQPKRHDGSVNGATLFANDTRVLTWSDDGTVRLWDTTSGVLSPGQLWGTFGQPMNHKKQVRGATLFASDTRVLTWSDDGTARIWDTNSGAAIGKPMRHEGSVNGATLFAGDTRVLTWSNDGTARVWDTSSNAVLGQPILRHEDFVRGATLFANDTRVLIWSDDGTAQVWDAASGAALGQPMRHEDFVRGATLFAGDTRMLTWSNDGTARVWEITSGKVLGQPMRHKHFVRGAKLFASDTRVLTWSKDGTVRVWDATSGEEIGQPMRHEEVSGATLFAGDTRVLTWSNDVTARIWDTNSGAAIGKPMRHEGSVNGATLFAGDTRVLTWSNDGTARVWDATSGAAIGQPMHHEDSVNGATLFAGDARVLTWSKDGSVRVWDANSGEARGQPIHHEGSVNGATLFASDARMLTWRDDGTVRVWDATSGEAIGQPMHHKDFVRGATLFAGDTRVLTWSDDGTARVWDTASGVALGLPVLCYEGGGWSWGAATLFADDTRMLAWGRNAVWIWKLPVLPDVTPFLYEVHQSIQTRSYINASGDWIDLTPEQLAKCQRIYDPFHKCEDSNTLTCAFKRQWWPLHKFFGTLPTIEDCLTPGETSP